MMIFALIKRHLKIYLRDRWAVFFSFLSVIIILVLFMVFFRNAFGTVTDTTEGQYMINGWIFSGVLMVATVTVPLGFLGVMVTDRETNAINDFYVAPIARSKIVISYLVAAIIIGSVLGIINLILGQVYMFISVQTFLPLITNIQLLLLIILSTTLFSSLFFYVVTFIKTANSHGTLSTLVGTLIGFLAGLYVVVGSLPTATRYIMALFPTLQMASLFRLVYMNEALDLLFQENTVRRETESFMLGIRIEIGSFELTPLILLLFSLFWITLFITLSIMRLKAFKK